MAPDTDGDELPAPLRDARSALLEQFAGQVSEPAIHRTFTMAVAAVRFFGDDPADHADVVMRMTRNELELLHEGRNERAWT